MKLGHDGYLGKLCKFFKETYVSEIRAHSEIMKREVFGRNFIVVGFKYLINSASVF